MRIISVEAANFRNYEKIHQRFSETDIHVLYGNNAQGKTNFLEILYLLKFGCLFANRKISEAIFFGQQEGRVKINCAENEGTYVFEMLFRQSGEKKYRINGKPVKGPAEIKGIFHIITFLPSDLNIIKLGPENRRSFFDEEMSSAVNGFFENLKNYKYSLKQRNSVIKQKNRKMKHLWDTRLVEYGSELVYQRLLYIREINNNMRQIHPQISGTNENIQIIYKTFIKSDELISIKKEFREYLKKYENDELQRGYSLIGPHRDDFIFYINNKDLKYFGSQGQKRNVLLTVKLAEMEYLWKKIRKYPVILLDDVFSELDAGRRKNFLEYIQKKSQVFITTAIDMQFADIHVEKIVVENGRIQKTGPYSEHTQ